MTAPCFILATTKINRERTFILAVKHGFHFADRVCVAVRESMVHLPFGHLASAPIKLLLQDTALMQANDMEQQVHRAWNVRSKPQLHKWLVVSQSEEDRDRLRCLGNIVMPKVAQLGAHLLEHHLRRQA